MSHDKRERGALADSLSSLTAADVAPGWEEAVAWQKLEHRIVAAKRRRIPVRSYVLLAAAASIACCILLLRVPERPHAVGSVTGIIPAQRQTTAASSISKATSPMTTAVQNEVKAAQPVMRGRNPLIEIRQALPVKDTLLPQPVAGAIPEPAQESVQSRIQRKPPIVYTLSEITADVPEHEEVPKKYTKIFLFRPVRAPQREERPATRQSVAPEAYNLPPIIN